MRMTFDALYGFGVTVVVVMMMSAEDSDTEINTHTDEEDGANGAKPYFNLTDTVVQLSDTHHRIRQNPGNNDDGQPRSQAEQHGHEPAPCDRLRHGERNEHSEKHHAAIRAESQREDDTQHECPQPIGDTTGGSCQMLYFVCKPVIMFVVVMLLMMSANEHEKSADNKERSQDRFAVGFEEMLHPFDLCAQKEDETQNGVHHHLAYNIHKAVEKDSATVAHVFADKADGCNVRTERARAEDGHESQEECRQERHGGVVQKGIEEGHIANVSLIISDSLPKGLQRYNFCRNFANDMLRKLRHIEFWALLLAFVTAGCHNIDKDAQRIEETIHQQETVAAAITDQLIAGLQQNSFDSVWNIAKSTDEVLIYIFNRQGLVFWSNNWLAGKEVTLLYYDRWYYHHFENAHAICRWRNAGQYNILTVIPVKYAYPFENQQLHNEFIPPFKGDDSYEITTEQKPEHRAVYAADGHYLFSLCHCQEIAPAPKKESTIIETFSYQTILTEKAPPLAKRLPSFLKTRLYFLIDILIFGLIFLVGLIGLIHSHGIQNMRLRTKYMYFMTALLMLVSIYMFTVSGLHVRQRYEKQQKHDLERTTAYIQKSLQEIYFWNMGIGPEHRQGLNIDLRDLAFTYKTDIHVYDLNGNILGSSTPELFDQGLVSTHIAPEPFFSNASTLIQYEHIGDMRYLAGYTELLNGSYLRIGYIAVPMFLSADELNAATDAFSAKLLPPILIALLCAILLSAIISRELTQSLVGLSEKMKHFKIGRRDNRLVYEYKDEIGQLVQHYNEMVDELERSAELLAKSEREGAWKTMARQIAHEINNPLTPMKLTLQQLQRMKQKGGEQFDEYFNKSTLLLIEQIDQLSHIAQSFSSFAKMPEVCTTEVDIAQKLSSVISLFRNNQEEVPIRYIGPDNGIMTYADEEQISQVFNNLIKNALQAIEKKEDGDIIIIMKELSHTIMISVSDNGCGIPEDMQDKVFRPNFTTKSTGMGLGLPISKNIVEGSGGTIRFVTSEKGTTFFVELRKV